MARMTNPLFVVLRPCALQATLSAKEREIMQLTQRLQAGELGLLGAPEPELGGWGAQTAAAKALPRPAQAQAEAELPEAGSGAGAGGAGLGAGAGAGAYGGSGHEATLQEYSSPATLRSVLRIQAHVRGPSSPKPRLALCGAHS